MHYETFSYDPTPLAPGEPGAGTFAAPDAPDCTCGLPECAAWGCAEGACTC